MKILQVYKKFNYQSGGVEKHIYNISKTVNDIFKTTFVCLEKDKDYFNIDIKIFSFLKIFEYRNYDVFHLHGARSIFVLIFFLLGKIHRKKIIYTPHCYYESKDIFRKTIKNIWDNLIESIFFNNCDCIILLNDYWLEYIKKKKFNISNVKIVPNCVLLSDFSIKQKLIKKNTIDILSLSRIDKVKRIPDIIESIKNLDKKFILHIVGDGTELKFYKNKYSNIKNIFFYGNISDTELSNLCENIDLFIIASEKEGMPTTIIEMVLQGIPVIASKIPGNLAILGEDYKFLFEVGDIAKLTSFIKNINLEYDVALYNKTKLMFTWEKRIQEIENIYLS